MYKIIGADQKEYGPISIDQLRQWIAEGRVNGDTRVQAEGQADWVSLRSVPELSVLLPVPTAASFPQPLPSAVPGTISPLTPVSPDRLKGPGIALLIIGILLILGAVVSFVSNFAQPPRIRGNPQLEEIARMMHGTAGVVAALLQLACAVVITLGGIRLQQARSYGLVMTASILAMIPCTAGCCCLAGLPIGIWVLMTINKPENKALFR